VSTDSVPNIARDGRRGVNVSTHRFGTTLSVRPNLRNGLSRALYGVGVFLFLWVVVDASWLVFALVLSVLGVLDHVISEYERTITVTGEAITIDSRMSWGPFSTTRVPFSTAITIAFTDLSTARSVSRRWSDFLVLRKLNGEETWVRLGGRDDVAAIADWVTGHIARQTSAED